jgi:hypothetical protein
MKGTQGLGKRLSTAAILIAAAISLALTACSSGGGGGDYDSAWVGDIETDVSISGSVGDGPTVNAKVTIRKKDGEELKSFRSDTSASYSIDLSVSERHFPLLVDATGGTDIVTNSAPDFVLRSAVLSPGKQVTANVNPFSTLAYELARDLNGGVNRHNLLAAEDIVASAMNSGLTTLVASGTIQTPIDSTNAAEIVKSSETMAEIVRRTRDAMRSAGKEFSADEIIEALGSDLIDGVIEGNGGRRADERIAAVATIATAEVLLEAMRNELRVNGADATEAMRAAVREVVPEGAEPGMDELGVTGLMIEQARLSLIAAYEITEDPAVYNLLQSLDGLHDGMEPSEAKTIVPGDYRNSLKGLKHMTAGGDRSLVAAVNGAARRGDPAAAPRNRAPVISGRPSTSIRAGERYNFSPVASDLDDDPLTFSITGRPAWADFDRTTGRLYGTPIDADAGSYDGIVITVSDGELSNDIGPFTITVQPDNEGPAISGTPRTIVGSGERYSFKPSVTDPDSTVFRFEISGKPAWAKFDVLTGRLYGTPELGDVGVYRDIVISVSDGKANASLQAFSIEVVDSRSATGSETLKWTPPTENEDGSPLLNLAGYRVYWGRSGESLSNSVRIDNPSVTRYVVENLAPGDYEFAVTAVNNRGIESRFSNIKAKTIE